MQRTMTDAEICAAFLAGGTSKAEIGRRAGISRQRVSQIIHAAGLGDVKPGAKAETPEGKPVAPDRPSMHWNASRNQWYRWSTHSWNVVRAARAIMEDLLGRKLKPTEWAVLLDGNQHNLDPSNIRIMSPTDARAHAKKLKAAR